MHRNIITLCMEDKISQGIWLVNVASRRMFISNCIFPQYILNLPCSIWFPVIILYGNKNQ